MTTFNDEMEIPEVVFDENGNLIIVACLLLQKTILIFMKVNGNFETGS